jgi:hypothetical protein
MDYICSYESCDKVFSTKYNLKRHIDTFHLHIRRFTCSECFKDFASKQNLQEHDFIHKNFRETLEMQVPGSFQICRDIVIPKLTDLVKKSDDPMFRPGVVVRRIYPYPVPYQPICKKKLD